MKMNKGFRTSLSVLTSISLLFASCSTKRTITISGEPGTEIFLPDGNKLGTIESNGKTKIQLSVRDSYHPYLLGKTSKSPLYVPFGVDYKYKSNAATATLAGIGLGVGTFGCILGIAFLAVSDGGSNDYLTTAGATSAGIGGAAALGIGLPASLSMSKTDVNHSFRYVNSSTDNDMLLTTIPSKHEGPAKYLGKAANQKAKKAEKVSKTVTDPKREEQPVAAPAEQFIHTVADGETLVSIAQQYGVTVAGIIKANKLTGNTITTGQQLVIPL